MVVGPVDNNVFVIRCRHTGEAVLLDAANEHEMLLDLCRTSPPESLAVDLEGACTASPSSDAVPCSCDGDDGPLHPSSSHLAGTIALATPSHRRRRTIVSSREGMNNHLVGSRSAPATNAQIWRGATVDSRRLLMRRMRQTQDWSHRLSSYLATRKPKPATRCQRGYSISDDTRCRTSTIGLMAHSPYQTALHYGLLWATAFYTVYCFTVDG